MSTHSHKHSFYLQKLSDQKLESKLIEFFECLYTLRLIPCGKDREKTEDNCSKLAIYILREYEREGEVSSAGQINRIQSLKKRHYTC